MSYRTSLASSWAIGMRKSIERLGFTLGRLLSRLRRWPWGRLGKWGGGVLLGSYLLYTALAASFLSLGGLAWATEGVEDIRMEVDSGYSYFPGRVHLRGMKLRVKDYNIQMEVIADRVEASIALWKLPFKKLHVAWIRVHGAEYKLAHRVHDLEANAERLAAFPEILGIDRPLYYDAPPEAPTEAELWSVQFDSIEADVRLAWLLEYQVRGKLQARGAFFLHPGNKAHVLPCQVDVTEAVIFVGEKRIVSHMQGSLFAQVETFNPRDETTLDIISKLSAGIEHFRADLDTLSFTELYFRAEPLVWDGNGQLSLNLWVKRGQVQDGSTARLELAPIILRAGTTQVQGAGELVLQASSQGRLDTEASFSFPEQEQAAFAAERLAATAAFDHQEITELTLRRLNLLVEKLRFKTPAFLKAVLSAGATTPASGSFDAKVFVDLPSSGSAKLDAEVATRSTNFYFPDLRFAVTADGRLACEGTRASASCTLEASAPLLLFDQKPGADTGALWLRAKSRDALEVSVEEGTLSGTLTLVGGDPKAVVSELLGEDWFAQLGLKLVPTGTLSGRFHVNRTPARISLTAIDLSSGSSRLQGYLHKTQSTSGAWVVDMPTNRWGFELKPSGVSAHPFVGSGWLAAH